MCSSATIKDTNMKKNQNPLGYFSTLHLLPFVSLCLWEISSSRWCCRCMSHVSVAVVTKISVFHGETRCKVLVHILLRFPSLWTAVKRWLLHFLSMHTVTYMEVGSAAYSVVRVQLCSFGSITSRKKRYKHARTPGWLGFGSKECYTTKAGGWVPALLPLGVLAVTESTTGYRLTVARGCWLSWIEAGPRAARAGRGAVLEWEPSDTGWSSGGKSGIWKQAQDVFRWELWEWVKPLKVDSLVQYMPWAKLYRKKRTSLIFWLLMRSDISLGSGIPLYVCDETCIFSVFLSVASDGDTPFLRSDLCFGLLPGSLGPIRNQIKGVLGSLLS